MTNHKTKIEWTDSTWSPITGCTKVSPGCDHCYIERTPPFRMTGRRFDKPGIGGTTGVLLHEDRITQPLRWRKPRRVFVNSMSDLFHDDVPDLFIARIWAVMAAAPLHTFQILTKRHGRMRSLLNSAEFQEAVRRRFSWADDNPNFVDYETDTRTMTWPLPNVWLGVSAEDQQRADLRIPALLRTPAAVRFVSAEPLLGPLNLTSYLVPKAAACWTPGHVPDRADKRALSAITRAAAWKYGERYLDWVIAGGESGPGARPMHPAWVRSLRDQCDLAAVAFHFKQRGEWTWDQRGEDDTEPHVYVNEATGATADEDAALADGGSWTGVWRVGKKRAGRDLDRLTHDEFPKRAA